jgi:peroxiredoxin
VEPDLLIAKLWTIADAQEGLTGEALANRRSDLTAPGLAAREWINTDKRLSLEDFKGQFVLIGFWATWSESSVKRLRQMQELHHEFGGRGLKVIGVHAAHRAERIEALLRTHNFTFPVMIDANPATPAPAWAKYVPGETAIRFEVPSLPAYFLLDRDGIIFSGYGMGPPSRELIESLLK